MKKFKKLVVSTAQVSAYECAIALGVVVGIEVANLITLDVIKYVALRLPVQIAVGVFVGSCATAIGLVALEELLGFTTEREDI